MSFKIENVVEKWQLKRSFVKRHIKASQSIKGSFVRCHIEMKASEDIANILWFFNLVLRLRIDRKYIWTNCLSNRRLNTLSPAKCRATWCPTTSWCGGWRPTTTPSPRSRRRQGGFSSRNFHNLMLKNDKEVEVKVRTLI